MEGHLAFVTVAKILDDVVRPLVSFTQQDAAWVFFIDHGAQLLEDLVSSWQVLAVRALGLNEVRDGVESESVNTQVHPEADGVEHFLHNSRLFKVEIGLVMEEPVPVELLTLGIPGPIRVLGIAEDDASIGVGLVGVRPYVVVTVRTIWIGV